MASSRKVWGVLVSVGLHALVLGWTVRAVAPRVEVAHDDVVLTSFDIVDVPDVPVRDAALTRPPRAAPARPIVTAPPAPMVPVDSPAPSRARHAVSARAPERAPAAVPSTDDDAEARVPDAAGGHDGDGDGDGDGVPTPAMPASGAGGDGAAPHGDGDGRRGPGRDEADYAAYGARIVALVMDELDRSPVPGIGPRDTIQLVLEVLPDGTLARTGYGRFDVAHVTRTSLGRLRMRQILKRVERASARFPDHPRGFAKSRFVVDVTVNFRPRA